MINRAWAIYKDNKSTFYDFRTNQPHGHVVRNSAFLILSVAFACVIQKDANDLLDAVITVQAILIGFSFSVMFFLVQSRNKTETKASSMEESLRLEQVDLLSKELFWNISYFNLTALSSLLFALALMVPNVWGMAAEIVAKQKDLITLARFMDGASFATYYIAKFLFCLLLVESSFTFLRTVGRVNFLFEERMKAAG